MDFWSMIENNRRQLAEDARNEQAKREAEQRIRDIQELKETFDISVRKGELYKGKVCFSKLSKAYEVHNGSFEIKHEKIMENRAAACKVMQYWIEVFKSVREMLLASYPGISLTLDQSYETYTTDACDDCYYDNDGRCDRCQKKAPKHEYLCINLLIT